MERALQLSSRVIFELGTTYNSMLLYYYVSIGRMRVKTSRIRAIHCLTCAGSLFFDLVILVVIVVGGMLIKMRFVWFICVVRYHVSLIYLFALIGIVVGRSIFKFSSIGLILSHKWYTCLSLYLVLLVAVAILSLWVKLSSAWRVSVLVLICWLLSFFSFISAVVGAFTFKFSPVRLIPYHTWHTGPFLDLIRLVTVVVLSLLVKLSIIWTVSILILCYCLLSLSSFIIGAVSSLFVKLSSIRLISANTWHIMPDFYWIFLIFLLIFRLWVKLIFIGRIRILLF